MAFYQIIWFSSICLLHGVVIFKQQKIAFSAVQLIFQKQKLDFSITSRCFFYQEQLFYRSVCRFKSQSYLSSQLAALQTMEMPLDGDNTKDS